MPGLRLPKPSKCVLVMFSFGNPTVWGVKNQNKSVHPQGQPKHPRPISVPSRRPWAAVQAVAKGLRSLRMTQTSFAGRRACDWRARAQAPLWLHIAGGHAKTSAWFAPCFRCHLHCGGLCLQRFLVLPESTESWSSEFVVSECFSLQVYVVFFWNVFFCFNHVPSFIMEVFLKLSQESCHAHGRRRDLGKAWKIQTIFCLWNQISGFHVTCLVGFMGMIIPMTNMPFQRLKR